MYARQALGTFLRLRLRDHILRRRIKRGSNQILVRGLQDNVRAALPSPGAVARLEHFRCLFDKQALLLHRELDHPMLVVRMPKRGKNLPTHAKVRMPHVRRFHRAFDI